MDVWPLCLQRLQTELPPEDIDMWLRPLSSEQRGSTLVLYAPNPFVLEEVQSGYLPRIRELLVHFQGHDQVQLEVGAGTAKPAVATSTHNSAASSSAAATAFQGNLDSHFTFENFVEGRSNQLGRAAAWQAAQDPGNRACNPLLLYGGTGLGKTHLMFAAGNRMRQNNPAAKVLYLRSEQFMNAFTKALFDRANGGMDAFKRQFRGIDALLIDDIQFFAGKDRTQEEFFHIFNALFEGKQQIILTCDRYPREVDGLEPRLKSRLGSGLAVPIDPPDFETRAEILLTKAAERGSHLPQDVAHLIAKRIPSNVRELEGALNSLVLQSSFTGQPITLEFAKETLRDLLRAQAHGMSLGNIQKTVADYYGVHMKDLLGDKRPRSIALPRQVAMALCKELTDRSLPEIGTAFGRDHSTVLHNCRKIQKELLVNGKLREDWDKLINKLSE